ncbi:MAG: sigma-E processing peptidase SpoIIGA [Bacillota bacterium]|nr:sigma-E processing peptidase SpoIIGA [Bacillota bacterium]
MYLDLVLFLNLAVNFFLLWLTGLVAHQKSFVLRLLAGSAVGSAYLLVLFIPSLSSLFSWLGKILLPLLMIYISFRPRGFKQGIVIFMIFYLSSFALGGLILAFSLWGKYPVDFAGGIYFLPAPSLFYLILAGSFLYVLVRWLKPLLIEKLNYHLPSGELEVEISFGGRSKKLSAFLDTGNMLKEPFSGSPVAVAAYPVIKELLPREICKALSGKGGMDWSKLETALTGIKNASRFCLVPYHSIQDGGLLLAFKPESFKLWQKEKHFTIKEQVIVGIQQEQYSLGAEHEVLLPLDIWRSACRQEG